MNNLIKTIVSLTATFVISASFGFWFKEHFWSVFAFITILQFVVFGIINKMYANWLITRLESVRINQIKEATRNVTIVKCPCSEGHFQEVDYRFDIENVVECSKCGKQFACKADISTALVTEPIYFEKK